MKLSRIINFILLIPVFCSFFIIYKSALLSNYFIDLNSYSLFLLFIALVFILISLLPLKFLDIKNRINFVLILISSFLLLFILNSFLIFSFDTSLELRKRITFAEKKGIVFDKRSKLEILVDLNKNIDAYSVVFPRLFDDKFLDNNIKPLSGISNSTTVYGNETGKYLIYKSDRYGFNNDNSIYDKNNLEYLIIGDSFAHGAMVENGYDLASVLRKNGYNTITIGMGGNGPLNELASLIEYGLYFKPKNIIWMHHNNDLDDLVRELKNPILIKYLSEDNFNQNLIFKHEQIDKILKKFHNDRIEQAIKYGQVDSDILSSTKKIFTKDNIKKILTLYEIRRVLKIDQSAFTKINQITNNTKQSFKEIFLKVCKISDKNNINFISVNVPDLPRIAKNKTHEYMFVENFFEEFFVKKIDFGKILINTENYKDYFPFGLPGHYNKAGYLKLSEVIINTTYSSLTKKNCNYN